MLDQEELRRRVVAARELRGLKQVELGKLFETDGLGLHDPGRIERGDITMQAAHRRAFVEHLRVPESWFTEPDADLLIARPPLPPTLEERLSGIERRLATLVASAPAPDETLEQELMEGVAQARRPPGSTGQAGHAGSGQG